MSKSGTTAVQHKNDLESTQKIIEIKCSLLKKHFLAENQTDNLKQLNEKIINLRQDLENHKKELFDSITSLQEISALNRRYEIEKEIENVLADSDLFTASGSDLAKYLNDLTQAVEHEKNKISFQKTLLESQDQLKELLSETELKLKSKLDDEESDINIARKLTTFLPSLEENLEKCNDSNEKCAEIIESLQRLILHQNTLQAIKLEKSED
ncbi:uncharacterized protein [Halyomorpha halys]|uniref:uncharacterized protein n=1 Tax=Halyomorpha halys TaxID=286706 RepID=UPI0006D4D637|nr:uncharacterized protein LOC106691106 isoform X2 [Halyomorpha halys]